MLFQSLKMAWSSILSNKMRSFLTMLGIIIGVIALIVLVSVVDGATGEVTDAVSSLGTNLLTVQIVDDKDRAITLNELEGLRKYEDLAEIAPYTTDFVNIRCGSENGRATVTGTTSGYTRIRNQELAYGRNIQGPDVDNHLNVAVINYALAQDIMRYENVGEAVGKELYLKGVPYQVIGVFEQQDSDMEMFQVSAYTAVIPYTSLIRISNSIGGINSFVVSAVSDDRLSALEGQIGNWLDERLNHDEDAYVLVNMSSIMSAMDKIMNAMTVMLGGIAAISLLVGGIGIMNIMLVSVTERTREIGIRKAIGAGQGSILLQFLIEALMLSLLGCALGVLSSWGILRLIALVSGYDFAMSPRIVTIATCFSLAIGMIFGIYPARKAAKKKPIDALHYAG